LINFVQPIVLRIKKSKTSKLMREILDTMALSPGTLDLQIELCRFIINWCKEQNKNFVRHKIEIRLGKLLFQKVAISNNLRRFLDLKLGRLLP
jgi:26S proteasome regulatory subunit N6